MIMIMNDALFFLAPPLLAGIILVGIHGYFGLHVLERTVIFVDLSLAQLAALGSVAAFLIGFAPHTIASYLLAFLFTLAGALFFAWSRRISAKLPQEAIIGAVYALASAGAILLLSKSPEGASHVQQMLLGDILTVSWTTLLQMTGLYSFVGLLHYVYRKSVFAATTSTSAPSIFWDFFFYATFGAVVTSSVSVGGVLLVFSLLIIPTSIARLNTERFSDRLRMAWWIGVAATFAGIALSFLADLPTGGSIIMILGIMYVAALVRSAVRLN